MGSTARRPLVSFIVRTHNRSEQLRRALTCLVAQTYKPIEILVVDHDSTDDTEAVAAAFGGVVRYFKHKGTFRDTFNVWRDRIRGDLVSPLDDDDHIAPDCTAKLARVLRDNSDVDVAFSRHRFFIPYDDRCYIDEITPRLDCSRLDALMLEKNVVPWNAVLFRAECLRKVPRIDASMVGAFDWYFWILMVLAGFRFQQVDEVLGAIQRSTDSVEYEIPRISQGAVQCVERYGRHLPFGKRIAFGYFEIYGFRLIRHAVILLDQGRAGEGRFLLLKGVANYAVGWKKRLKLIPALSILLASLVSEPQKARTRMEKLFGIHLFRNYHQIQRSGEGLTLSGFMLRSIARFKLHVW